MDGSPSTAVSRNQSVAGFIGELDSSILGLVLGVISSALCYYLILYISRYVRYVLQFKLFNTYRADRMLVLNLPSSLY
eukprot:1344171-Amorphochlora_amoeboformis.AAC.1